MATSRKGLTQRVLPKAGGGLQSNLRYVANADAGGLALH